MKERTCEIHEDHDPDCEDCQTALWSACYAILLGLITADYVASAR